MSEIGRYTAVAVSHKLNEAAESLGFETLGTTWSLGKYMGREVHTVTLVLRDLADVDRMIEESKEMPS